MNIHNDTWNGKYFGKDGVLRKTPAIEKEERKKSPAKAAIGAASTYYGAFNHAAAMLASTRNPIKWIIWLWRMNTTYFKAMHRVYEWEMLVWRGEHNPVPSEYDVAGSVRAVNPLWRKRALDHFTVGLELARNIEGINNGLLLVKIGRTYGKMGNVFNGGAYIRMALRTIHPDTNPEESCRIYRDAGDFLRTYGDEFDAAIGIKHLLKAREIALNANLPGAVLKIAAVMNKHKK